MSGQNAVLLTMDSEYSEASKRNSESPDNSREFWIREIPQISRIPLVNQQSISNLFCVPFALPFNILFVSNSSFSDPLHC